MHLLSHRPGDWACMISLPTPPLPSPACHASSGFWLKGLRGGRVQGALESETAPGENSTELGRLSEGRASHSLTRCAPQGTANPLGRCHDRMGFAVTVGAGHSIPGAMRP